MATPNYFQKLQEKNDEDRPIPEALVDDSSLINNGQNINQVTMNDNSRSKREQNASNEDTTNGNSSEGNARSDDGIINQSPTKSDEGSMGSNGVPSSDNNPKNNNPERSISTPSNHSTSEDDVAVSNVVARSLSFVDGQDNFLQQSRRIQLFSINQQPGNKGGFLKMELDGNTGLKVTTTGAQHEEHAFWLVHFTLDQEKRQFVVFENERCSKVKNKKCVLYTQKATGSDDYVLTGKTVDKIPKELSEVDPYTGFLKHEKEIGSELQFIESVLSSEERSLLVGFDGAGQPIPLNKVTKYSRDFQAFFRIIEAS